jgi:putative FmdB family regulatory protein
MSGGDMPTYRYRCSQCGDEFELWQSIKADPIRTHDDGCGGELLKVLTPAGIVLKGSGFYKNDSRSSSEKRKAGDGSKPNDDGGSSEATPSSSESESTPKESGTTKESGATPKKDPKNPPAPTKSGDSKSTAGAAKPT